MPIACSCVARPARSAGWSAVRLTMLCLAGGVGSGLHPVQGPALEVRCSVVQSPWRGSRGACGAGLAGPGSSAPGALADLAPEGEESGVWMQHDTWV